MAQVLTKPIPVKAGNGRVPGATADKPGGGKPMISSTRIARRVRQLGRQISETYADIETPLVIVVILKGATVFAADLLRCLSIPAELEFVRASSYGSGTASSGSVKFAHMVEGPLRGRDILLVEDNRVNQMVMQRLLTKRGHRVTTAATGMAAIEAAQHDSFDLIFMDVQMPEMDGFEATRAIRRRESGDARRLPIIALTAHAMSGDRERCLEAGMDSYMTKPIDTKELDEVLSSFRNVTAGERFPGAAAGGSS